jgi:putative transposase
MGAVEQHRPSIGTRPVCEALGVARSSYYRRRRAASRPAAVNRPRHRPARALSPAERQEVLDLLHSERFMDKSPGQVVATQLDENRYFCSERTMYRILAEETEVRERRNQLRHPEYKRPELLATGPNQVWTWDITKLRGPVKWTYYQLYVLMDIFSRYVVGWLLAHRESVDLAKKLIAQSCEKQGVEPGQLAIHADRGTSMTSKGLAQLLADLGVDQSHSRPRVSNDNPFSESQFRTLKYMPDYPDRFGSFEHALSFCRPFFNWHNKEHRHSGIAMLTPHMVHYGEAEEVLARRHQVMLAAHAAHPERFVHGAPKQVQLHQAVWINPPRSLIAEDRTMAEIEIPEHSPSIEKEAKSHQTPSHATDASLDALQ